MAYLASTQVKRAYPTAYRDPSFDLYADNTTERNVVGMVSRIGGRSFVAAYDYVESTESADLVGMSVSLGGYLFELTNSAITALINDTANPSHSDVYLYIRVAHPAGHSEAEDELVNADDESTAHNVLDSEGLFRGLGYALSSADIPAFATESLRVLTYADGAWSVPSTSYVILDSSRVGDISEGDISKNISEEMTSESVKAGKLSVSGDAEMGTASVQDGLDVYGNAYFGGTISAEGVIKSEEGISVKNASGEGHTIVTASASGDADVALRLPENPGTLSRVTELRSSSQGDGVTYVASANPVLSQSKATALTSASLSGHGVTTKRMTAASSFTGASGTTAAASSNNTSVPTADHTHDVSASGPVTLEAAYKSIDDHTVPMTIPTGSGTFTGTKTNALVTDVSISAPTVTLSGSVSQEGSGLSRRHVLTITATSSKPSLNVSHGDYTPAGSVTVGTQSTSVSLSHSGNMTSTSANVTVTGTASATTATVNVPSTAHTHGFTPAGSVSTALSDTATAGGVPFVQGVTFDTIATNTGEFLTPSTSVTPNVVSKVMTVEEKDNQ